MAMSTMSTNPSSASSSQASGSPITGRDADLPRSTTNIDDGLRLGHMRDSSSSYTDTPDISPAPSLLPLAGNDELLYPPEQGLRKRTQDKTVDHRRVVDKGAKSGQAGAKTKTKTKKQATKSPLLEALKLPKLSEISIPAPTQVKFAPLHIPPHRRLQTLAVVLWTLAMPISLFLFFFFFSFPILWPIAVPYLLWVLFIDKAHVKGGRPKEFIRRLFLFKYFAQYYPCSIVKEAELPADRTYVFGYHPHGIIGMGAVATFGTEATGFSEYFPGVKPHLLTLDSNFKIPFYRDLLMSMGICSVSRRSCRAILDLGPGNAITIVVGGAAESLAAHPGTHDLTLKRRFGFIKVAIREGAELVPVFSFGENDIYDQLANDRGTTVYKTQKIFQKIFGFTLPLFHGRGIFNYNLGLMPFRHPIVSVIGKPIPVTKTVNPTDEYVQEIHQLYIEELLRIWNRYKDLYAKNRTRELTLVD